MATTATVQRRAQIRDVKEYTYLWEGTDRNNRQVRGEMRGRGPVRARLLAGHQGLQVVAVPLDRGGRADLDRRVTGEGGAAGRDHMAEEDNSGEAERGGTEPLRCAHAASNQGAGSW